MTSLSTFSVTGLGSYSISNALQLITISQFSVISNQTTITFTVYNVLPPSSPGSTSHYSSIIIYSDSTLLHQIVSYTGSSTCTVNAGSKTGTSAFTTVSVFPNGAGLTAQMLYLEFSLEHSLPATSTINIMSATGS